MKERMGTTNIVNQTAGPLGVVFFMAFIGAAIYFVQQSGGGFWPVILGLLKAAVWPVFLIYHVLLSLGV